MLKKDINLIINNFNDSGFYNAKVTPNLVLLDGNVVNLVLDIDRGEKYFISNIFFIGEKFYSSSSLKDVISSSPYGWWKFLSNSTTLTKNRLEYDSFLLKKFYLDRGFFDVQIVSKNVEILNKDRIDVIFSINSGSKYNFGKIEIFDQDKILSEENKKTVNSIVSKRLKGEYSLAKISKAKDIIYDYLNSKKIEFYNFNIREKKIDNKLIKLDIIFVKTKSQFVNLINIKGNSITEEKFIRSKITFSEGDAFENYKINKSINNLKSSGIFKEVSTKIDQQDSKELIDVNFEVEEQPTGSISAGLGIGTAGSTISTSLQEKNLFGKGINMNSIVSLGTEKINANINLAIPDFRYSDNTLNAGLYAISTDYKNAGYESSKFGNTLALTYDLYEDISLQLGFGLEQDSIDVNTTASQLYKDREGNYQTIKSFYSISSDKRNNSFLPTSGHIINLRQTLGLPGSDIPFLQNKISGSYYYPVSKKFVINMKGGVETNNSLKSSKDVKLSDRLFLSNSKLRGFESYGIGPKDGKDHIGGNYSYYGSLSSTFPNPFPDKWNAKTVAFIDSGNVWGVDYNESLDSDKIRSSVGTALEWVSPLGPVSFTFSQTLTSAAGDLEENFNFIIGSTF